MSKGAIPSYAFGAAKWAQYIGDVGIEPPIPASILNSLESTCPFDPSKKVKDTHILVLIPQTVDGKPFCMDLLRELVQAPKGGGCAAIFREWFFGYYEDTFAPESHWVLMTRTAIHGSRNQSWPNQQKLVADIVANIRIPYEIPNLLDATTTICMEYVQSGTNQYEGGPGTRTTNRYCEKWIMAVGGRISKEDKFPVDINIFEDVDCAISLLRKS